MTVGELFTGVRLKQPLPPGLAAQTVSGLDFDSRRITPGSVFFAFAGSRTDGREFARQVLAAGAVAVAGLVVVFTIAGGRWMIALHEAGHAETHQDVASISQAVLSRSDFPASARAVTP